MQISNKQKQVFQRTVWNYYKKHGRDLPWRNTSNPYHILVSEVMLQQTQVSRVLEVYPQFIRAFPTVKALAEAPFPDVLAVWQGMGYNRRAKYLHDAAQVIAEKYKGRVPRTYEELVALPGIGPSTAGGVLAFAFNIPVVFIETNIRRVFIHHFFPRQKQVSDQAIGQIVTATLDAQNPKEWYYALFDYGSFLGKSGGKNPNLRSKHYAKQSPFEGSRRQLRGRILKAMLEKERMGKSELFTLDKTGERTNEIPSILSDLEREGFITRQKSEYILKK